MEARAKLRNLRMSPKKVRLVIDMIRGLDVIEAKTQLSFLNKKAAYPVKKLLDSAIANATNNLGLREDNLFIKEIMADGGPTLKRWRPRAFGRASKILKRTSHILIVLAERVPTDPKKIKKPSAVLSTPTKDKEQAKEKESQKEAKTENTEKKATQSTRPKQEIQNARDIPNKKKMDEHTGKIFDTAQRGKHRHMQHQDKKGS